MVNKIKENVNYLRNSNNLSRRQFSYRVKVPYTVVERLEKGITKEGKWLLTESVDAIRSGEWKNGRVRAVLSPETYRRA